MELDINKIEKAVFKISYENSVHGILDHEKRLDCLNDIIATSYLTDAEKYKAICLMMQQWRYE